MGNKHSHNNNKASKPTDDSNKDKGKSTSSGSKPTGKKQGSNSDNEKSKKIAENKKPQLVRLNSNGKAVDCAICLEAKIKGLTCECNHFICVECFSPYVDTLCDDIGKLKSADFSVQCPVPSCTSPHWNSYHIRNALDEKTLERYIDLLVNICNRSQSQPLGAYSGSDGKTEQGNKESNVAALRKAIVDALSINCPQCKVVLDPNPDGCCAMKCMNCAAYFCWLCCGVFPTSAKAHAHVRTCPNSNNCKNVFVPQPIVKQAHNKMRIKAIREILIQFWFRLNPTEIDYTSSKLRSCPEIVQVLQQVRKDLSDLDINAEDILSDDSKGQPVLAAARNLRANIEGNININVNLTTALVALGMLYLATKIGFLRNIIMPIWETLQWDTSLFMLSIGYFIASNGASKSLGWLLLSTIVYFRSFIWKVFEFVFGLGILIVVGVIGMALLFKKAPLARNGR